MNPTAATRRMGLTVAAGVFAATTLLMSSCSASDNPSRPGHSPSGSALSTASQPSLPPGAGSIVPTPPASSTSDSPSPSEPPLPTVDNRTPIQHSGTTGTPRGLRLDLHKLDRANADDVTTAFGQLFGSSDTKIDTSEDDAGRRAAALATPVLAKELRSGTSVVGPDAMWSNLAAHHGYTTVKTRLGGAGPNPPDTTTTGGRVITLYVQRHGDHNWAPAPDAPQTLLITLHRTGPKKPWSVSQYKYL